MLYYVTLHATLYAAVCLTVQKQKLSKITPRLYKKTVGFYFDSHQLAHVIEH